MMVRNLDNLRLISLLQPIVNKQQKYYEKLIENQYE